MAFYRFTLIYILGKPKARMKTRFEAEAKFRTQETIKEGVKVLLSLVEALEIPLTSLSLLPRRRL